MTNAKCQRSMNSRLKSPNFPDNAKEFVVESLPNGINDHILCTTGIKDLKSAKGTFSVSTRKKYIILNLNLNSNPNINFMKI